MEKMHMYKLGENDAQCTSLPKRLRIVVATCAFQAFAIAGAWSMATAASAADWPQWQGPDRNAISNETGLLQKWPEGGPPLAWRIDDLGTGYSAPSIADGKIYGMSNRGGEEVVWALSESDGSQIWQTSLAPAQTGGMPQGREGTGCTPTVDGDRIYVLGHNGDLACLNAQDGQIVWRRSLTEDLGGRPPTWRYNESPLVDGDKVICTPGGEDATLVALDKSTGELIWKTHVPDGPERSDGRSDGDRGGRPRRAGGQPSMMQFMPVLVALDADQNREISADEINGSPAAIETMDKNQDAKISEDELRPEFGNRGGGPGGQNRPQGRREGGPGGRGGRGGRGGPGGMMRFMPVHAALDADESGAIDAAEIKDAAAALLKLDRNTDGKLTEDEVRPQFGGGGPPSGAAYASAIAIDFEGQRQYVQLLARTLVGVAAADGKLLWRYDRAANNNRINCSTPLYHDGLVFAASAYGNGGGAVKLSKDENGGVTADEVYFTPRMQNHHGGMIVVDGALYGANGGNEGGFLVCLDFNTGIVLWRDRQAPKGSLAMADGRLYLRSEEGEMLLIEPNREQFVERGRFEQPDRSESPAWSHPVIANGKLYVRDQEILFCYDVKALNEPR
jgi:outer membrane protein assembly factor BamB